MSALSARIFRISPVTITLHLRIPCDVSIPRVLCVIRFHEGGVQNELPQLLFRPGSAKHAHGCVKMQPRVALTSPRSEKAIQGSFRRNAGGIWFPRLGRRR